jgi:branched-subunit amino acid aminotransferase/4-amino-4-deoxychorismate lyase
LRIPEGLVWVDGTRVAADRATVTLADPAIQAGIGAFETLAVRDSQLLDWEAHHDRLERSAEWLGVRLHDRTALAEGAAAVAAEVAGGLGWLKIVALRGGPTAIFAGAIDPAAIGESVSAILLRWRRSPSDPLAHFKTLNYAPFALGLEEARRRGADEGLWLNTRGHVAEGCSSSVFVVRRRTIFTAAVRDGILPGVTRAIALEAARALGIVIHEGKLRLKKLETADEAFLSSSVRGVRPLVRFEGRPVGRGLPGPITRAIADRVAVLRKVGTTSGAVAPRAVARLQGDRE